MIEPWWDLNTSMSREIGQTLIFWSNNMHSHPFKYTADEWQALLYMHGCALLRYGNALYVERVSDPLGYNPMGYYDEEYLAETEAKIAMQWIADNFESMWD